VVGWLGLDGRSQGSRVLLVGHRAEPERGEENTSAGVRSAATDAPVGVIEIDVRVVGGVPVGAHDQRADRHRAGPFDVVLGAATLCVMADPKEAEAGPGVAAGEWPAPDRLLYVGNPDAVVAIAEARVPGHLGLTWEELTYPEEWLDAHGASVLNVGWWCARAEVVARAHTAGRLVTGWTVDNVDLAPELARLGVDAIVTNVPLGLVAGLGPALRAPEGRPATGEPAAQGRSSFRLWQGAARPSRRRLACGASGRRQTERDRPARAKPQRAGRTRDTPVRAGCRARVQLAPFGLAPVTSA